VRSAECGVRCVTVRDGAELRKGDRNMESSTQEFARRLVPWPAVLAMAFIALVFAGGAATIVYGNVRGFVRASAAPHVAAQQSTAGVEMTHTPQVRDGGGVEVVVQWQGISAPSAGGAQGAASAEGVFSITFDTHSVDLDGYTLDDVSVLHTGSGEELRPTRWDFPQGGHHRKGTVAFPAVDSRGNPLFAAPAESVELVLHDVAGVDERAFRWTR
jgi:hypothetical protein